MSHTYTQALVTMSTPNPTEIVESLDEPPLTDEEADTLRSRDGVLSVRVPATTTTLGEGSGVDEFAITVGPDIDHMAWAIIGWNGRRWVATEVLEDTVENDHHLKIGQYASEYIPIDHARENREPPSPGDLAGP